MPGSGTAVPPDVVVDELPEVEPPKLCPPDEPLLDVLPPELEVDEDVEELDEDELDPGKCPLPPTQARAGLETRRATRTVATVAMRFMEIPLSCRPQPGRVFRLVKP